MGELLALRWEDVDPARCGGAASKAIQDLAGHQSIAVTNRYIHLAPGALRAAIDLLEPLQAGCKDIQKTA